LRDQFEDAAQDCRALIAVTRLRFIVGQDGINARLGMSVIHGVVFPCG
jgi:hypothetical protein